MYEIILMNENGERFKKEFNSPYLFNKFLNKVKHSKKLKVLGYGKKY